MPYYPLRSLKKRVVSLFLLLCMSIPYILNTIGYPESKLPVSPIISTNTQEKSRPTQFHEPLSLNLKVKQLPWNFVQEGEFPGQEHVFHVKETLYLTFDFDFKLNGKHVCRVNPPFLLVMVPSLPGDQNTRALIRKTWGSVSQSQKWPLRIVNAEVKVVFLLGNATSEEFKDIQEENKKHQDIIMDDFVENYRNLSRKILMGLTWVKEYCSEAQFILKCDQDTFPNIPLIVDFLIAFEPQFNMTVIGCVNENGGVRRNGRWQVNKSDYPISRYPPYTSGAAYIMQRDLAFHVLNVSKHLPYITNEDAYITGILTRTVHGKHVHSKTFTNFNAKNPKPCEFLNDEKQANHRATEYFMQAIWKTFQTNTCS